MTVSSTLSLQDKMSSVFKKIANAGNSSNVTLRVIDDNVKKVSNSMDKGVVSSNSFIKSLMGFSIVKNIFSMITGQVDSAISRMDTLNNYTNVMSNLGVSEDEANASRERLSEGLQGLPTTLDSAVSAVQRFTSANGNIGASTEMYLALNNAILAGRCRYECSTISTRTAISSICKR